jgi:hypothetical protein
MVTSNRIRLKSNDSERALKMAERGKKYARPTRVSGPPATAPIDPRRVTIWLESACARKRETVRKCG